MGDTGARMLSKALQVNKTLRVIHWDHNNTLPNGFHDIAAALEKYGTTTSVLQNFKNNCWETVKCYLSMN